MYLLAVGTSVPDTRYTKAECWEAFAASNWFETLDERSRALAKLVLHRDNGIAARRLAVDSLAEVFAIDADTLHRRFVSHAPKLGAEAARDALRRAGLNAKDIDAVIVTTCTGYLCPGLSSYAIEHLGLRQNVLAFDLVGQGCAGALPNWQLASALLDSGQCNHVLSVCVEVSSAAMYLDNDPGVLISACLFGDGAGAAVLSRQRASQARCVKWHGSVSVTQPAERDALRFEQRNGLLRNVLTRAVPRLAAEHAGEVFSTALARAGVSRDQVNGWIMHAGGRDVLSALESRLELPSDALQFSRAVLYEYGNLSSAFVYFVLAAALAANAPGGWWWMSSFGAGFSCHGALLAVE
jgi:predicted naringenin-chalcone synthase